MAEAVAGADDLVAKLDRIAERASNMSKFYDNLEAWWRERQTAWFASSKIAPNDPRTIALKGSNRPLVDTGNLRDATMRNQPFNKNDSGATFGLRKGTPEMKLGILMESGPRGAPARSAVVGLTPTESADILDLMGEWLMEGAD